MLPQLRIHNVMLNHILAGSVNGRTKTKMRHSQPKDQVIRGNDGGNTEVRARTWTGSTGKILWPEMCWNTYTILRAQHAALNYRTHRRKGGLRTVQHSFTALIQVQRNTTQRPTITLSVTPTETKNYIDSVSKISTRAYGSETYQGGACSPSEYCSQRASDRPPTASPRK